ncbi:MAG: hypothetical protein MJ252_15615, partial [archaeon]|nr:hypothetical protein [archaeon]
MRRNNESEYLTTEEGNIYKLVDDIVNTENKILTSPTKFKSMDINKNKLNYSLSIPKNSQRLTDMNSLLFKKEGRKDTLSSKAKFKERSIRMSQSNISSQNKNENNLLKSNDNLYSNYLLRNNLCKNSFPNPKTEEENLKNKIEKKEELLKQLRERLLMLKEEKNVSKENLNEYISKKESIEEMLRIMLQNLTEDKNKENPLKMSIGNMKVNINMDSNINSSLNQILYAKNYKEEEIDIYTYEILKSNLKQIIKEVFETLSNIIQSNSINNKEEIPLDESNEDNVNVIGSNDTINIYSKNFVKFRYDYDNLGDLEEIIKTGLEELYSSNNSSKLEQASS